MTLTKSAKIFGATIIAVALTGGAAYAGNGKDCGDKHKSAMKTEAAAPTATAVLDASAEAAKAEAKKMHAPLTVEQATAKCKKYGADDLDACVAKKMAKYGPKS